MLKNFVCASALIGALTFGSAAVAQEQNFTVVNKTGHVVMTLQVSPSSGENWGPDLLGTEVLQDGETAQVNFDPQEDTCEWDLRVTYDDGGQDDWRANNLCEIATVELTK